MDSTFQRRKPQCATLVDHLAHFLRVMSSLYTFLYTQTFSKSVGVKTIKELWGILHNSFLVKVLYEVQHSYLLYFLFFLFCKVLLILVYNGPPLFLCVPPYSKVKGYCKEATNHQNLLLLNGFKVTEGHLSTEVGVICGWKHWESRRSFEVCSHLFTSLLWKYISFFLF